jgi:integrase
VRKYLMPHLGMKPVAKVTKDDLRAYRVWLEDRGICLQTVKHILSDARCLFRWAEDSDYVERSPFPRRLMPKIQERPPDRLTDDEVAKLVSLPDPHGFIIRLGLGTGLRWGEIARAKTSDIQDGMLVVSQTKSRKLRRVPLPPDLQEELRNRVGLLSPIRSSATFNRQVRQVSGVERFHAHQLRHTMACRWLERGGSLAALQEILGHASVVVTQRYARLAEAHVKAEAARIAGAVSTIAGRFVEDSEKAV